MPEIRKNLAICPQHNTLFDWLTVEEHLLFCGRVRGVPKAELKASIDDLLSSLNLEEKRKVISANLSGGMLLSPRFACIDTVRYEAQAVRCDVVCGSPEDCHP
jgi:ABC-type nitrate/sulfonate/bicarbonate transport system ATPase subunit